MKRIVMALVCLMTIVIGADAQNWQLQAKQNAVKIVRCRLKSPSSFILTNAYGEKIPVNNIHAEYFKEKIEYDSVIYGKDASVIDSIEYVCDRSSGRIIDSLVYTSYKTIGIDSIVYYKVTYYPCYRCSFFYEAQNSYGGMVQGRASVYVTENEQISQFLSYNERPYTKRKHLTKIVNKLVPVPPIKRVKSFEDRLHYEYNKATGMDVVERNLKTAIRLAEENRNRFPLHNLSRGKDKRHTDDVYF